MSSQPQGIVPELIDGSFLPGDFQPGARLNILLVDDNPGKLMAHEAVLSELQENVVTATTGREALQKLLRQDFAVILLDVNMPELDGFETAKLIRQRPKFERIPIIFVTAYNTTDLDRLHGYKLGAVDYLFLPVVPDVLKAKVKVFVELERQNQIIRRQAEHLAIHNREQARQLQMIQELNRTLTETNRELESFSYSISHDLRAPLRALRGYGEYLIESCRERLDETGRECIYRIHRAAISLDNLTHDLLDYTHIAREKIELQPLALGPLIEELIHMNPRLQDPGVDLCIEPELHSVMGHRSLLIQCLSNLIHNAVKFVAPDARPQVRVRSAQVNGRIRVYVEDNGIGIPPAYHHKVFGLFERVGEVQNYEGTGVGLAIVARAVERMNGSCGVKSTPGVGSSFWIELAPGSGRACSQTVGKELQRVDQIPGEKL